MFIVLRAIDTIIRAITADIWFITVDGSPLR